ncbi:hypothetical protein [Streptomyces caniscabiei]|uniref:Uncharacterized protein n=1 Tax=Streptomyces caniscabiei TaxID=2746961 RepID=A0ABU4MI89_9ACTN|nr:hypothetical protein [Streptomyces caniscabiei]MBE4790913.1 hypothetical protein [Streptomyces caniscabiei]MDX2953341.1 hypothetical protein [Streptomyces caniscabiei]MDX2987322.1 hypothetical protein [Streptomyces caniscabiei]MDX3009541.1 hypothetical protein [Streptomyces caniscabiei]MDX3037186.1 hypothetical protein [Streptomyces caniscabiei]
MYRAKDTFWVPGNRRIVKGDLVAPDDPAVEGREGLFEEVVIPQALAREAAKPAAKKTAAKKTTAAKPSASAASGDSKKDDPADEDPQERTSDGGGQE